MLLSTDDIVKIVAAGGGIILDTKFKTQADLVRIAAASRKKGPKIVLRNLTDRSADDLVVIAAAGQGAVIFDLEQERAQSQ